MSWRLWRFRIFYARREMVRGWVAGTYRTGLWVVLPSGRARPWFVWGPPVVSMYGPGERRWR